MDKIDNDFPDIKDKIRLNQEIFALCVDAEIIGRDEAGGRREIQVAETLSMRLTTELSESRENADRHKEDMK